ncbi:hypothetical protein H696_03175 [Fonticula alba]|uniref:Uncharacterized protein n=1 Tax=Fonticula alba TaxID=691883 RepID=A0A058ZA50_FONAL|nr:hypothetical protein H696_03175 [Fonticula alba]KCV70818.1 hypothetical protein H696_03175 [Fonticula alba]|eukprot:XP_009495334.1 hypothetical protein H696_03175 [Fonticula alba]
MGDLPQQARSPRTPGRSPSFDAGRLRQPGQHPPREVRKSVEQLQHYLSSKEQGQVRSQELHALAGYLYQPYFLHSPRFAEAGPASPLLEGNTGPWAEPPRAHADLGTRQLVACCLVDVLILSAPEPPFPDGPTGLLRVMRLLVDCLLRFEAPAGPGSADAGADIQGQPNRRDAYLLGRLALSHSLAILPALRDDPEALAGPPGPSGMAQPVGRHVAAEADRLVACALAGLLGLLRRLAQSGGADPHRLREAAYECAEQLIAEGDLVPALLVDMLLLDNLADMCGILARGMGDAVPPAGGAFPCHQCLGPVTEGTPSPSMEDFL